MPSFVDLQATHKLTTESDFSSLAQACIEAYYIPPYPNEPDHRQNKEAANRVFHGGLHAARTAMCAELFLELYTKYAPQLVTNSQGAPLTDQEIKLLKLAALYHDSANISEIKGTPIDHANLFMVDMVTLGYTQEQLQPFADAIQYKDAEMFDKTLFMKIVQSADCLEIIRCLGTSPFKKEILNIHTDLQSTPGFINELNQIIDNHYETIAFIEGQEKGKNPLHLECEYSSNCYLTLYKIIQNMFISTIILDAANEHKFLNLRSTDLQHITLSDLFNRKHSTLKKIIIETQGIASETKQAENSVVMNLFHNKGILFRALERDIIDAEFETLRNNFDAMNPQAISPFDTLRDYVLENKHTPNGLKWRLCTLLKNGIPIATYKNGKGIGVLIDPRAEAGTTLSFFYKQLIYSGMITVGNFKYTKTLTGVKDKETLDALSNKVTEQNLRRIGGAIDLKAHYYGEQLLSCSEVLGTYLEKSIIGVVAGTDPQDIKDALILRAKLGEPIREIYHYSPSKGLLTVIPEHELLQKAQQTVKTSTNSVDQMSELRSIMGLQENILTISPLSEGTDFQLLSYLFGKTYAISFETHTLPNDTIKKIKDYFETIPVYDFNLESIELHDPVGLQCDYNITKSILHIHITFINTGKDFNESYFKEEVKLHVKAITRLLEKIQFLENNDILIGNRISQPVEEILKDNFILAITQYPTPEEISSINPIKYSFIHPADNMTKCVCYVKDGAPIMEFHFPGKEIRTEATDLLPKIANKYFKQTSVKLMDYINEPDVKGALANIGILNFSMQLSKRDSTLLVEYQTMPGFDKNLVKNHLLSLLGSPIAKELTHDYITRHPFSEQCDVLFSLPEIQKIETFASCFKRLVESAELKQESKDLLADVRVHTPPSFVNTKNKVTPKTSSFSGLLFNSCCRNDSALPDEVLPANKPNPTATKPNPTSNKD